MHIVACAQATVWVNHKLRHYKQADALHTFGRTGHAGQHQMDDVFGHIVLTPGDEDFGAKHLVGAIRQWLCAGTHHGQIGACLGFGQVHGAGPFAADQVFQIGGFQFV